MIDITRFWDAVGAGVGLDKKLGGEVLYRWAMAEGWSVEEYVRLDGERVRSQG